MAKMVKITLTKSTIGASPKQRKVVEAANADRKSVV